MDEIDGQSLFAEAMGKVQPLTPADKVAPTRPKPARPAAHIPRRAQTRPLAQSSSALSIQPTGDPWVFVADGVSRERLKRLAAGRPPVGRSFDLHGMTRNEALAMLDEACEQALCEGVRVFCIIHGRGLHSQGRAILKEAVYQWLRQGPLAHRVLAVMPQPGSGGGACLLLMRRT